MLKRLLAALAIASLTGCINQRTVVLVNPDGSGNIIMSQVISKEAAQMMESMTAGLSGLGGDATSFLRADMERQLETTYADVFGTLGAPLGRAFPLPGSFSGYLFSSSLPRFIPYLAGKVPAIIGAVTIAEIVFSFPGLGSTLLEALLATNTDLLVASVFILLCVNAIVAFVVKSILFLVYPRWYEKTV